MSSFEFDVTYEDGVQAGDDLMKVVTRYCHEPDSLPRLCTPKELEGVFEFVVQRGKGRRLPYVEGFLSQVVRLTSIKRISIIDLWGVDAFIENQEQYAPICNIPPEHQFIQFGSWCGELSDGDGLCIDFYDEYLRCLPVACCPEVAGGMLYVKSVTYGCFPALDILLHTLIP